VQRRRHPLADRASRSWRRELMESLANTLRRCHSIVLVLRKSRAPISEFVSPSSAISAICRSCAVNWSFIATSAERLRTVSPVEVPVTLTLLGVSEKVSVEAEKPAAVKFMHDEFGRSPTLDEIAAKAHLSPFHFHRRFTDLLGQTPKHFLLACQIHRAKELLVERKKELAEIAKECGFAHQSHFTSRFKQATGLTPTRWRRLANDLEKAARA